jgi:gamma-glutamyltranspeptidase/glutathione hydrolase
MRTSIGTLAVGLALLAACAPRGQSTAATLAPDLGKRLEAAHAVVTSAHPRASEAGVEMLRKGGNAVDAAVATAVAVSVGEPQMSGLGGGGSMLIWLQAEQRAEYVDFYSAQRPASWRGLTTADGARTDLRDVAIPGEVAGLLAAHERYGRLSRAEVMEPAIRLAEEGYPVNQILAQMIEGDSVKLSRYPSSLALFFPGGRRLQPGDRLRQPELAATLRRVAAEGRAGFYAGAVGEALVRQLNEGGHPATMADLAAYQPQWKRPLCGEYRGRVVLSAPPPQTGHQILHTLELLEAYDLRSLGLPTQSARAFDVLTSAMRVGMTSARYGEDPNWASAPVTGVISPAYAESRRALVGTGRAAATFAASDPTPFADSPAAPLCAPLQPYGSAAAAAPATGAPAAGGVTAAHGGTRAPEGDSTPAGGETTHLSVVDAAGNAVALTQTNSSTFGVGARADAGFMLNDSGIDFTRDTIRAARAGDGRNEFWIRRSTIAPTIVLENGRAMMVVGAPGGGRIPTEILQNMVYVLDYGLDPLEALRLPRIFPAASGGSVQLEHGFPASVLGDIRGMGYEPASESFGYARLYMIVRGGGGWIGVADPRHDGGVRGY